MDPPTTSLLVQFFARCWRRDCFWQRHDRRAFALDAATGKVLWELPLNSQPAGYTIDLSGWRKTKRGYSSRLSLIGNRAAHALMPEIPIPSHGSTLMVFSLPDAGSR